MHIMVFLAPGSWSAADVLKAWVVVDAGRSLPLVTASGAELAATNPPHASGLRVGQWARLTLNLTAYSTATVFFGFNSAANSISIKDLAGPSSSNQKTRLGLCSANS